MSLFWKIIIGVGISLLALWIYNRFMKAPA